jgi:60 kDa SS-A/Ro ribonucleoprotein
MANKGLFKTLVGKLVLPANAVNAHAAPAYAFTEKHALAQYATTGCLSTTFYASAEDQLETVTALVAKVEPEFLAKVALFCRGKGYMKDMPALLCAMLSVRSPGLLAEVFDRVIDTPKMLRNFVQIMRSGQVCRKSMGTLPKRLVLRWIENRTDEQLFLGSVGAAPSLADVIKMVHPKPATKSREALFGYLIGRAFVPADLPAIVQAYEAFKSGAAREMPDVPFGMLTSLNLTQGDWKQIARNASWQTTRMNLNTFGRHGVLHDAAIVELIAKRLVDRTQIARARVFPYQLLAACLNRDGRVPNEIADALQDAMEIAIENVPALAGKVYVFPDVSGSMKSPVTGHRKGATTAVKCVDVAALIAAAILRKNPRAEVIAFEQSVVTLELNSRDSVMTNAAKLAVVGGGGTNCSAPLRLLNERKAVGDTVIYVSDFESWVDAKAGRGTETLKQWNVFKQRNPKARMVCIDLAPNQTTQAAEAADILNVGGFSDHVFEVVARFAEGKLTGEHWVGVIEAERI